MKIVKIMVATIIIALVWTAAFAQTWTQEPPRNARQPEENRFAPDQGPDAPPSQERREQIRKKIEALRVWRMTEALDLDEKTAAKFLPAISALSGKRNELTRENLETMRELRLYLQAGNPDEKKIRGALDRLEHIHHELTNIRDKENNAAKEHLTVEQQARYIIFQQEFQREISDMLAGARGGRERDEPRPGYAPVGPRRPR